MLSVTFYSTFYKMVPPEKQHPERCNAALSFDAESLRVAANFQAESQRFRTITLNVDMPALREFSIAREPSLRSISLMNEIRSEKRFRVHGLGIYLHVDY